MILRRDILHRRSGRGLALCFFACAVLLGACATEQPDTWHTGDGHRWRALAVERFGHPGFDARDPGDTGVTFVNHLTAKALIENRNRMNGAGVALGDVDGDGWADLYLARLEGPNVLYRNLGRWRFEDITATAGVAAADRFSTGASFADYDGDGDLDLLVTAMGGPNALYANDGTGVFTEVTDEAGVASRRGSTTAAWADIDGDGDLDLYVGNYKRIALKDTLNPDEIAWENVVRQVGEGFEVVPSMRAHYEVDVIGERLMRFEKGEPDELYLNDGAGRFTTASFTDGRFRDEDGQPLTETPTDWTLTVRLEDLNGDGAVDLYTCNDFESPDRFWLGDGRGGFRAVPRLSVRKTSGSTMSVAVTDVEGDGDLDLFLADMLALDYSRRQIQNATEPPLPRVIGEIEDRPQVMQNALLVNRGDGTYAEVAWQAGVAASEWTWASRFLDVDLDGREDLLLTTGHVFDIQHGDAQERERMKWRTVRTADQLRRLLLDFPPLALPNMGFRNLGEGRFAPAPDAFGLAPAPDVAHGLATADLDHDGDLDVVVNRLNDTAGLFENRADAPRLAVRLRGLAPNTDGIGARVTLHGGPVPQTRSLVGGGEYLSSSEPVVVFAPGASDALWLEVVWASGRRSVVAEVGANRLYEIDEAGAMAPAPAAQEAETAPMFTPVALGHRHHEAAFDDFARQPLLPRRLSQSGPSVVWGDVDGDGDVDLLIGTGRGGRVALYRNAGGVLTAVEEAFAESASETTGLAVVPGASGAHILVGLSNIEGGASSSVAVYRMAGEQAEEIERLDFGPSSVGPLAVGDLDGDGDLDVFAGSSSVPGRYPEGGASRVYLNEGGRFVYDARGSAGFAEAGLVTGAAVGDVDGDGRADVVVSTEWGALGLYLSDGAGGFASAGSSWGLSGLTGWWRGVSLGDVDGDGRLDVVGLNEGWNTWHERPEASGHPLRLYYGDVDRDGRPDPLEAHYAPTLGGYVPTRGLLDLSAALPLIRRRTPTFRHFARSTLAEIIPSLDAAPYREARTLAHTLFLNRGSHFDARPLPDEAQRAPAAAAVLADFDRDGALDLFLAQNDFALPIGTPRRDAGRGLLLRGDGAGGFAPVPGTRSGLAVYGEQRGAAAADYDGDGWLDLVVSQNGAATMLYRGTGR